MPPVEVEVDGGVFDRFPGCAVLVVRADGFGNGASSCASIGLLRAAEDRARERFGDSPASDHPHVRAWRDAYSAFGAKPSRYFSSVESLLRRVLKGVDLPAINRAVDAYNAVSISHVLPVGGEDADALVGTLRLRFAGGGESFDLPDGKVEHPERNEVVWADDAGVTCRRWNSRQGARTRLTNGTRSAVFVLERLPGLPVESLLAAGDDLIASLRALDPAGEYGSHVLRARG